MSFLHPLLLGLLAVGAAPVILHLLMRPKPKRLIFPALRLIEARRKTNVRRLRLRHLWLLILRVLILALLVIAIARPLVPAAGYALTPGEWARLAGIAAACAAAYFAAVRLWGRATAARHQYLYRRTLLRGGVGAAAAILVLLLVGWPYARRVSAEIADPQRATAEDRPVAAVFLFDSSRSMDYQLAGKTRLDAVKAVAAEHLGTLPSGSRVAIAESSAPTDVVFQADLGGAKSRIAAVETKPAQVPLDDRLLTAFDALRRDRDSSLGEQASLPEDLRRDPFVRAVYVFTDLAASAWTATPSRLVADRLESEPWLQLYLVDAGVTEPTNIGLSAASSGDEIVTAGTRAAVRGDLTAVGPVKPAVVELYVDGPGGPVKQGQAAVRVEPGAGGRAEFPVASVEPPFVRGELRLATADPLAADDVRYFTIAVEKPARVLVVSDAAADGFQWSEALAALGTDVTRKTAAALASADLAGFDAIYLIDLKAPSDETWKKLAGYVRDGGGLGVVLGSYVDSFAYNGAAAQEVLPGRLLASLSFRPPATLAPPDETHPLFARFPELGGFDDLTRRDVRRYWSVEPAESAGVPATFASASGRKPAVLARSVGGGRVVMLTTGVDIGGWSDLPLAGWPYVALADQTTRFLAGRGGGRRNVEAGRAITIDLGRDRPPEKLLLRRPNLEQVPIDVPAGERRVTIAGTEQLGHYTLTATPGAPAFTTSFSVNLPAAESDLTRLKPADLDARFGEGRYQVATDPQKLEVAVRDTTLGAELMPYLFAVLVAVYCGEQLVANRFYDEDQRPEAKAA